MTAPHPKVQNNGIVTVFFGSPDRDIVLAALPRMVTGGHRLNVEWRGINGTHS